MFCWHLESQFLNMLEFQTSFDADPDTTQVLHMMGKSCIFFTFNHSSAIVVYFVLSFS